MTANIISDLLVNFIGTTFTGHLSSKEIKPEYISKIILGIGLFLGTSHHDIGLGRRDHNWALMKE